MAIYNNRICRNCGVTFSGGPRAWYCPECRHLREAERAKKYRDDGFQRRLITKWSGNGLSRCIKVA